MRITKTNRLLSIALAFVLVAALALTFTACKDNKLPESDNQAVATVIGEGEKQFKFTVIDRDGNETAFDVRSDAKTVGEALLENELISGEEGAYGLYVKVVNGIEADYDKDATYWGFYIDGEYAMTGVDSTPIEDGKTYTFKVEK